MSDRVVPRSAGRLFEVVAEGLLAVDVPEAPAATRRAVAADAAVHAAGMPDVTRLGVRAAGALLVLVCLVATGRHPARLTAERRGRLLGRLSRVPLVGEYVRLVRGVGLVCFYDAAAT